MDDKKLEGTIKELEGLTGCTRKQAAEFSDRCLIALEMVADLNNKFLVPNNVSIHFCLASVLSVDKTKRQLVLISNPVLKEEELVGEIAILYNKAPEFLMQTYCLNALYALKDSEKEPKEDEDKDELQRN